MLPVKQVYSMITILPTEEEVERVIVVVKNKRKSTMPIYNNHTLEEGMRVREM